MYTEKHLQFLNSVALHLQAAVLCEHPQRMWFKILCGVETIKISFALTGDELLVSNLSYLHEPTVTAKCKVL